MYKNPQTSKLQSLIRIAGCPWVSGKTDRFAGIETLFMVTGALVFVTGALVSEQGSIWVCYVKLNVLQKYLFFWQVNFLLTSFWPKNTWSWSSADVCLAVQHSTPLTTILLWISKIVVGNIPQRVVEIFCHMDAKAFSLKIVFASGEQQTTGSLLNFWYQDTQPTALLRPCFSQSWKAGDPTQQPWT